MQNMQSGGVTRTKIKNRWSIGSDPNFRLRLHLALTCDLYPDVVHIHIEKTSVNALLVGMLSDQRVCSRGSQGSIVIGSQ